MAIQMRPDYVNPLTMKKAVPKLGQPAAQPAAKQGNQADKVTELQSKQQQLQNQMLLLKATGTDSAGATAETQKIVAAVRPSKDLYEPEKADAASPGIYQIEKDEEQGYKISFSPYSEN